MNPTRESNKHLTSSINLHKVTSIKRRHIWWMTIEKSSTCLSKIKHYAYLIRLPARTTRTSLKATPRSHPTQWYRSQSTRMTSVTHFSQKISLLRKIKAMILILRMLNCGGSKNWNNLSSIQGCHSWWWIRRWIKQLQMLHYVSHHSWNKSRTTHSWYLSRMPRLISQSLLTSRPRNRYSCRKTKRRPNNQSSIRKTNKSKTNREKPSRRMRMTGRWRMRARSKLHLQRAPRKVQIGKKRKNWDKKSWWKLKMQRNNQKMSKETSRKLRNKRKISNKMKRMLKKTKMKTYL